jgi:hypothetical protein
MKTALVVVLFIASAFAQEAASSAEAPTACGSPEVRFDTKLSTAEPASQLEAGKALIYVVEDQRFKIAKDVTVRVGLDGAWVGATRGNSHLSFAVEPGDHHLCVDWVSDWLPTGRLISLYGLTVEPGKVYYFRARTMASPAYSYQGTMLIDLDLVNTDEGKFLVNSSPLSILHPKK